MITVPQSQLTLPTYVCHILAVRSFVGSDITCFSGGSNRHFSGFVLFLSVLSSDAGVDCVPSINDGVLDSSARLDGGYLIPSGGFLDIRKPPVTPVEIYTLAV